MHPVVSDESHQKSLLSDRLLQSQPSVDLVMCLLDLNLEQALSQGAILRYCVCGGGGGGGGLVAGSEECSVPALVQAWSSTVSMCSVEPSDWKPENVVCKAAGTSHLLTSGWAVPCASHHGRGPGTAGEKARMT